MFTGLIEAPAPVQAFEARGTGALLVLGPPEAEFLAEPWDPRPGDSIAVSGCCLTVVELLDGGVTTFELSAETLGLTWFEANLVGGRVNVERSVRASDRLGGHLVSGHVDGLGTLRSIHDEGDGGRRMTFEVPPGFERWLITKGSIAIDGISLTVVAPRERVFDVAIIPETLKRTTLGEAPEGCRVHLEADAIGKWVERLVAPYVDRA